MEERLTAIRRAFAGSAWEMGLAEIGSPGAIRSISFEPTGRVLVVTSGPRSRSSYQFAALIAHYFMLQRTTTTDVPFTISRPEADHSRHPAELVAETLSAEK
jgi:hypothetical protein